MKIASLALLFAALPILAQAQTPTPAAASEKPASEPKIAAVAPAKAKPTPIPRPVKGKQAPAAAPVAPAPAQKAKSTKASATPAAPPAAETQEPKKGVFSAIGRVFGGDKAEASSASSPVRRALPAPGERTTPPAKSGRKSGAPKSTSAPKATPEPRSTPQSTGKSTSPSTPEAPVTPTKKPVAAIPEPENDTLDLPGDSPLPQAGEAPSMEATSQSKAVSKPTPTPKPTPKAMPKPTPKPVVEFDRQRYLDVKQKAAQDPKVAELGKKLDAAAPGEAHKTAARRYTKALFKKMNELDSSQPQWFEKMESATMRRIDAGKPVSAE